MNDNETIESKSTDQLADPAIVARLQDELSAAYDNQNPVTAAEFRNADGREVRIAVLEFIKNSKVSLFDEQRLLAVTGHLPRVYADLIHLVFLSRMHVGEAYDFLTRKAVLTVTPKPGPANAYVSMDQMVQPASNILVGLLYVQHDKQFPDYRWLRCTPYFSEGRVCIGGREDLAWVRSARKAPGITGKRRLSRVRGGFLAEEDRRRQSGYDSSRFPIAAFNRLNLEDRAEMQQVISALRALRYSAEYDRLHREAVQLAQMSGVTVADVLTSTELPSGLMQLVEPTRKAIEQCRGHFYELSAYPDFYIRVDGEASARDFADRPSVNSADAAEWYAANPGSTPQLMVSLCSVLDRVGRFSGAGMVLNSLRLDPNSGKYLGMTPTGVEREVSTQELSKISWRVQPQVLQFDRRPSADDLRFSGNGVDYDFSYWRGESQ